MFLILCFRSIHCIFFLVVCRFKPAHRSARATWYAAAHVLSPSKHPVTIAVYASTVFLPFSLATLAGGELPCGAAALPCAISLHGSSFPSVPHLSCLYSSCSRGHRLPLAPSLPFLGFVRVSRVWVVFLFGGPLCSVSQPTPMSQVVFVLHSIKLPCSSRGPLFSSPWCRLTVSALALMVLRCYTHGGVHTN